MLEILTADRVHRPQGTRPQEPIAASHAVQPHHQTIQQGRRAPENEGLQTFNLCTGALQRVSRTVWETKAPWQDEEACIERGQLLCTARAAHPVRH